MSDSFSLLYSVPIVTASPHQLLITEKREARTRREFTRENTNVQVEQSMGVKTELNKQGKENVGDVWFQ